MNIGILKSKTTAASLALPLHFWPFSVVQTSFVPMTLESLVMFCACGPRLRPILPSRLRQNAELMKQVLMRGENV